MHKVSLVTVLTDCTVESQSRHLLSAALIGLRQVVNMLSKTFFLALLLAFAFAVSGVWAEDGESAMMDEEDEYVDPVTEVDDQALLIAHKQIKESKIVQGVNMTVAVSLYNVGKG